MATLLDLITTDPPEWKDIGGGRRLAVMIAAPVTEHSLLGVMVLGTDVLAGLRWLSIVNDVRGVETFRGSRDGSNNVGTLRMTLDNRTRKYSPWTPRAAAAGQTPTAFSTGTLMRVTAYTPGVGWRAVFTGTVQSWVPEQSQTGREAWVKVDAAETTYDLARVNTNALAAPVGELDWPAARIRRLLDAANWRFGYDLAPDSEYPADWGVFTDGTDMAGNRLAECYLTAASLKPTAFRASRDGRALLHQRSTLAAVPVPDLTYNPAGGVQYVAGTLVPANDDEFVVNVVQLAAAGGTVQTWTNDTSRALHGDCTGGRRDLLSAIGPVGTNVYDDLIAADMLARGATTIRPVSCDVSSLHGTASLDWLTAADINAVITVTTPEVTFHHAEIGALAHRIIPRHDGVTWTCTVHFTPSPTSSWS